MRPIQEILNTLLQSFQQESALASLPKMANSIMDSLIKRVKEMLDPQKTTAPFAQAFRTKPGIPDDLHMGDDDDQLDEYVPGSQQTTTPKL